MFNFLRNKYPWNPNKNKIYGLSKDIGKIGLIKHFLNNNNKLKILEIGVAGGNTTLELLNFIKKNDKSQIIGCDPFKDYPDKINRNDEEHYVKFLNRFDKDLKNKRLVLYRDFSFNFLVNYISKKNISIFDAVIIDGDHRAKYVIEDFLLSLPLVKTGGYIMFDDYLWFPSKKPFRKEHYNNINQVPKERISKPAIDFISTFKENIEYVCSGNNNNLVMFKKLN